MIYYLDDSRQTVDEFAVGEKYDAADLHLSPLRGADAHFGHGSGESAGTKMSADNSYLVDD